MSGSTNFKGGAVRSADANHLDFTSLPLIGLIGVARTAAEGMKYGRYNYMLGMPVHDLINHGIRHWVMYLLGDRTEPHLEHGGWAGLAAIQSALLNPELSAPYLLGPGATISPELRAKLAEDAPILAARRGAGEFADAGNWSLAKLPEIVRLLGQRAAAWGQPVMTCELTPEQRAELEKAVAEHRGDLEIIPNAGGHPNPDQVKLDEFVAKVGAAEALDRIVRPHRYGSPSREISQDDQIDDMVYEMGADEVLRLIDLGRIYDPIFKGRPATFTNGTGKTKPFDMNDAARMAAEFKMPSRVGFANGSAIEFGDERTVDTKAASIATALRGTIEADPHAAPVAKPATSRTTYRQAVGRAIRRYAEGYRRDEDGAEYRVDPDIFAKLSDTFRDPRHASGSMSHEWARKQERDATDQVDGRHTIDGRHICLHDVMTGACLSCKASQREILAYAGPVCPGVERTAQQREDDRFWEQIRHEVIPCDHTCDIIAASGNCARCGATPSQQVADIMGDLID